jgi:hypothetical protein
LREYAPLARDRLDDLLDLYDADPGLLPLRRACAEMGDPDEDGVEGGAA